MPDMLHVQCAVGGCPAVTDLPSSRDVYGRIDPFDEPTPVVVAGSASGWTAKFDGYFCPKHRDTPRQFLAGVVAHRERKREAVAAFEARWKIENPAPVGNWRPWKEKKP